MYALNVAAALLSAFASCPRHQAARLTRPQYEAKVQAVYAGVQSAFQATRRTSGRALAERIALAQKALRHASDELLAVRPPVEVEADNKALAEAMRDYARALDEAARGAASGVRATMARFEDASTMAAVREMAEAAERMKYKGYRLGAIAKE